MRRGTRAGYRRTMFKCRHICRVGNLTCSPLWRYVYWHLLTMEGKWHGYQLVMQVHWVFATVHTLLCTLFCNRSYRNLVQVYMECFLHAQANIRNWCLFHLYRVYLTHHYCQISFVWKVTFYYFILETKCLGAIQVLRNAIFLEIGPTPTPS